MRKFHLRDGTIRYLHPNIQGKAFKSRTQATIEANPIPSDETAQAPLSMPVGYPPTLRRHPGDLGILDAIPALRGDYDVPWLNDELRKDDVTSPWSSKESERINYDFGADNEQQISEDSLRGTAALPTITLQEQSLSFSERKGHFTIHIHRNLNTCFRQHALLHTPLKARITIRGKDAGIAKLRPTSTIFNPKKPGSIIVHGMFSYLEPELFVPHCP